METGRADLSVSIVNTNNRKLLQTCLQSVYENTAETSFEIIVVDNCSTDGSAEMVRKQFPDVKLVYLEERHGYRHVHAWKRSPFRSLNDVIRGARVLRRYRCSGKPVLFRPAFGKLNILTLFYVLFSRRRLVFWNVDPRDYAQESAEAVFQHVSERLAPGAVILLHDGRRNPSDTADVTVAAVKMILEEAAARGLALRSISGALARASEKS